LKFAVIVERDEDGYYVAYVRISVGKARVLKAVDEVVANPYAGIKLKGELEGFGGGG